jgi:rsbT co-antagonist protein RsbR
MSVLNVAEAFEQRFGAIVDDVALAVVSQAGGGYRQQQLDEFRPSAERGMALFGRDLAEGTLEHFASFWLARAPERIRSGYGIDEMLQAIVLANEIVIKQLLPFYAADLATAQRMIHQVCAVSDHAKLALFQAVVQAREEVIRAQMVAIQELSAPLVPIFGGVLVLPLIGVIDSRRAEMIIASLLDGITQREARIVLLDITGVPVVDTAVAHHLLQAARAVRLLGAELVLVGIRPEIAQTIVQLGVNLSDIVTRADLQAGFAYALERHGLQIAPRAQSQ